MLKPVKYLKTLKGRVIKATKACFQSFLITFSSVVPKKDVSILGITEIFLSWSK
jgi:hypothetical protein